MPKAIRIPIVRLKGAITWNDALKLVQEVRKVFMTGANQFVVDLSKVTWIEKAAWQEVKVLVEWLQRYGRVIKFCAPSKTVMDQLALFGAAELIDVYTTEAEALQAATRDHVPRETDKCLVS